MFHSLALVILLLSLNYNTIYGLKCYLCKHLGAQCSPKNELGVVVDCQGMVKFQPYMFQFLIIFLQSWMFSHFNLFLLKSFIE